MQIQDHNIGTFYQVARERDFARKFQFRVSELTVAGGIAMTPTDLIYAETLALPGKQINNIPVPYMGVNFNVPGVVSYPGSAGYKVTFRCDKDYNLRSRMEDAMTRIFDIETSSGGYSVPSYDSVLTLTLMNKRGAGTRVYTLRGVYIQSLDDEQLDIKDTGNVQMISTTIAYQYWTVEPVRQTVTGRDTPGQ